MHRADAARAWARADRPLRPIGIRSRPHHAPRGEPKSGRRRYPPSCWPPATSQREPRNDSYWGWAPMPGLESSGSIPWTVRRALREQRSDLVAAARWAPPLCWSPGRRAGPGDCEVGRCFDLSLSSAFRSAIGPARSVCPCRGLSAHRSRAAVDRLGRGADVLALVGSARPRSLASPATDFVTLLLVRFAGGVSAFGRPARWPRRRPGPPRAGGSALGCSSQ